MKGEQKSQAKSGSVKGKEKLGLSTTASLDRTEKRLQETRVQTLPNHATTISSGKFFSPRNSSTDPATNSILKLGGNVKSRCAAKLCRCNRITGSPFSRPAESKTALDERNINEGKTRRRNPRIDRAHVIRRGEDATRQLRSGLVRGREHVRNISSGDFDILRKIRYESAILPLHSMTRAPTWSTHVRNRDVVEDIEDSFYDPPPLRPSIFDRRRIHQRWFRMEREIRRLSRARCNFCFERGCDVKRKGEEEGLISRIVWIVFSGNKWNVRPVSVSFDLSLSPTTNFSFPPFVHLPLLYTFVYSKALSSLLPRPSAANKATPQYRT